MFQNDYIYSAGLDAGDIYAELHKIDTSMKSLGKDGAAAFNQVEKEAQQAGAAMGSIGTKTGQLRSQFGQLGGILQQIGGGTEIGKLGVAIGVVSGGVEALTAKLIDMAAQAAQSFQQIYGKAIEVNQQMESAQFIFSNILGGNTEQAKALVGQLKDLAQYTSNDPGAVFGFAQSIAPSSETVGTLKDLITITDSFADLDPTKNLEQLAFSVREALSGDFVSAKDQLNLDKATIEQIKEYQKELGNAKGLVVGLTEYLESRGLGTDAVSRMAGSVQAAEKSVEGLKSEFIAALGQAPFEAYRESMNFTAEFLNDNREPLLEIAYSLGDILASFSRLGNSLREAFAGDVDITGVSESFRNAADQITEINLQVETLIGQMSMLSDSVGGDSGVLGSIIGMMNPISMVVDQTVTLSDNWLKMSGYVDESGKATNAWAAGVQNVTEAMEGGPGVWIQKINDAMVTLNQLVALAKAGWDGIVAGIAPVIGDISLVIQGIQAAAQFDFETAADINDKLAERQANRVLPIFDLKAAHEAAKQSILESVAAMDQADRKREEYYQNQKKRSEGVEELPEDTQLGAQKAKGPSEEFLKAEDKINRKMESLRITHVRKMQDIMDDYHNKQADAAKDAARKRESIERSYQRSVEDINRKYAQQIAEVSDFSATERQLATKHRQELAQLERDAANERLQIEKDYQRQLQQIQNQYAQDSEEAARANNAAGFLRAKRTRDQAVKDATTDRDQRQQDAAQEFAQRREALLAAQQQEIADAREAAQQKLADLREKMQEELEAAELKRQRDLEDAKIIEEQKSSDLDEQISRRIQAEIEANNERIADAQRALSKELEIVRGAESQKQAAIQQTGAVAQIVANQSVQAWQTAGNAAMAAIARMQAAAQQAQASASALSSSIPYSQQSSVIQRRNAMRGLEGISGRAFGGTVLSNRPYLVGERGPELFTPNQTGQITPNNRLMSSPAAFGMGGAVTYNQQRVDLSMLDPSQVSPAQRAAMRQEALAILAEL